MQLDMQKKDNEIEMMKNLSKTTQTTQTNTLFPIKKPEQFGQLNTNNYYTNTNIMRTS